MQILLAEEMRALDRAAEEEIGIPGLVLMENAGRAVADAAEKMLGSCCHKKIVIFAGKGNNGGDGSGAGRWLHNRGASVTLVLAGLAAEGVSVVDNVDYVLRGYEDFAQKLRGLGAQIELVTNDDELQKAKLKIG